MKTDLFQSCGHCWVFQICQHIECSTLTASSLRIFPTRDQTQVSHIEGRFFTSWATREALYAEYIIWNAWLDEAQTRIKIAERNINNLRYANDTTLMAESEEELKRLLMKVKEESEKTGLKHNIQKMKIRASSLITSWQIDGETMETVTHFICEGLQNHCRWWLQSWN